MGLFDTLRRLLGVDDGEDGGRPDRSEAAGDATAGTDERPPRDAGDGPPPTADDAHPDETAGGATVADDPGAADATPPADGGAASRADAAVQPSEAAPSPEETPTPDGTPSPEEAPPPDEAPSPPEDTTTPAHLADAEAPREAIRTEAAEFVDFWSDVDLDYAPASLRRLDAFVADTWDEDRFEGVDPDPAGDSADAREMAELVAGLGAYVGETVVQHLPAEWHEVAAFGWGVAVVADERIVAVSDPFGLAADALRGEASFAASYDALAEAAGTPGIDGRAVEADLSLPPADGDPATFREWADDLTETYSWYDLDYSPESLAALDDLVAEEGTAGPPSAERVERIGAYLGGVLGEHAAGEWVHDDREGWVVALGEGAERPTVDVFGTVLAVLTEGAAFADVYGALLTGEDPGAVDDGPAAGATAIQADPETAAAARESAAELAESFPEYDLDYSPESLARLDDLAAAEVVEDLRAELAAVDEEVAGMLVAGQTLPYGCYFCEVLRREREGAVWIDDEGYTLAVPDADGAIAVGALRVAAAATVGDTSFAAAYERVLADL